MQSVCPQCILASAVQNQNICTQIVCQLGTNQFAVIHALLVSVGTVLPSQNLDAWIARCCLEKKKEVKCSVHSVVGSWMNTVHLFVSVIHNWDRDTNNLYGKHGHLRHVTTVLPQHRTPSCHEFNSNLLQPHWLWIFIYTGLCAQGTYCCCHIRVAVRERALWVEKQFVIKKPQETSKLSRVIPSMATP